MERVLTELDKSILLAILSLSKGKQYIKKEFVVMKFSIRQRKMVNKYFDKLVKDGYLTKHPATDLYKLTEVGLKRAMKLLSEGAMLWKL